MSETHGQRALRVFGPELAQISDHRIKDFVFRCFEKICPDYFWERAASKRGVYHPGFVDGKGGLVRHVKYGCWWFAQICRSQNGSGVGDDVGPKEVFDPGMAAIIMHDMVKDGDEGRRLPKSPHKIGQYHGVELMDAIWDRVLEGKLEFPEQAQILFGVAAHMGPWTQPESFRPWNIKGDLSRKVAELVHMADYCASRKVDEVMPALAGFNP